MDIELLLVSLSTSIRDVMSCIGRNAKGIALVVDDERHLIATVTDGDTRRAILAGVDLDLAVSELLKLRSLVFGSTPKTAPVGTSDAALLHLMTETNLRQI